MLDSAYLQGKSLSFGKKRKGLKDIIDICAYTGEPLEKKYRTKEHIIARHPKEGPAGETTPDNLLIVSAQINRKRGNTPLDEWLMQKPNVAKNIQAYLDKFRGIMIDNKNYVQEVKETLNREAKGVAYFTGNTRKNLDLNI